MLAHQADDGGWGTEVGEEDVVFGRAYPTALSVLTLTPPYQLLPIFQR